MSTTNLELKVTTTNNPLQWEVFLQSGDPANKVLNWDGAGNDFTRQFLVSPDKNNLPTSRIGLNFEFGDFFDVKKTNTGAFNRLSIGLTVNFSL